MPKLRIVAHFEENRENKQQNAAFMIANAKPINNMIEGVIKAALVSMCLS